MMADRTEKPIERRPIQSRDTAWAEATTRLLVTLRVSPNAISLLGMLAALAGGTALFATSITSGPAQRALWFSGGLLCQARLLCNLLDGMVAVARNIASPKGELYNEVPDRISDMAVLIGLGYSAGGDSTLGYVAAIVSVFVAYVRAVAKSIGAANDFCGPMAKPQRMALVTVVAMYLAFSPVSWRLSFGEPRVVLIIVIVGGLATAWRRLVRAARQLGGIVK